ncbi:MAG TPA: hypothetical protein VFC93_04760 [Chloroflexota bacterium]|nr:hypothetical protein [Chloroflexota bacterium]
MIPRRAACASAETGRRCFVAALVQRARAILVEAFPIEARARGPPHDRVGRRRVGPVRPAATS